MAGRRSKPAKSTQPQLSTSEKVDRELAAAAIRKRQVGETPTGRELGALRRYERQKEEELRWTHYRSIPQKHWREMSGRQTKILQEQAARYGLPFSSRVVDLPALVRALHDFLAKNHKRLGAEADPLLEGNDSVSFERYRSAKADMAEMDRDVRRGSHVPLDELQEFLSRYSSVIRGATAQLRRRFGNDPADLIEERLVDLQVTMRLEVGDLTCNLSSGKQADRQKPVEAASDDA